MAQDTPDSARMPASAVLRLDGPEAPLRRLADTLGEILDIETTPIGVFESDGAWRLSVYCADAAAGEDMRALVADIAGAELGAQLRVEPLAERDWVAASLAGLSPVVAGRYFVHGAHDRARAPRNAVAIELEAALAFGTGHHGTTRGCLLALDAVLRARPPRRVLDVGTGTGILAIAAALSTRRIVMAGDIDPRSVTAARGNARANGVGAFGRVSVTRGVANRDFVLRGPYDLVFANILLGPLQRLAAPIRRVVAPGGNVILSGLLSPQANAALSAYRTQGLVLRRRIELEGWTTLLLERPRRP